MSEKPKKQAITRNPDGTFPKGVSGNLGGRPVGSFSLWTLIEKEFKKYHEGDKTKAQIFAEAFVNKGMEGNFSHMKEALDRADGSPVKHVEADVRTDKTVVLRPHEGDQPPLPGEEEDGNEQDPV